MPMVYSQKDETFQVKKGPVFANFVLADEINRAPAKVQSALLEAMQERGINPYASEYSLKPNEVFRTPECIFTYSTESKGKASRDFQRWARNSQLKDAEKSRMTFLNKWEATYFDFNED